MREEIILCQKFNILSMMMNKMLVNDDMEKIFSIKNTVTFQLRMHEGNFLHPTNMK